jgi:hypothetical protein
MKALQLSLLAGTVGAAAGLIDAGLSWSWVGKLGLLGEIWGAVLEMAILGGSAAVLGAVVGALFQFVDDS